MNNNTNLLIVAILVALVLYFVFKKQEGFRCKDYRPGDISHCPRACDRYQYPDMYSVPPCTDPFGWGFTYSTGRCPQMYLPTPRRLPSRESFDEDTAPWYSHGGGASYNDPKHTESTNYGYNYS